MFVHACLNEDILINCVFGGLQEYKPARFEDAKAAQMDPFAYLPFSAGSRYCQYKGYFSFLNGVVRLSSVLSLLIVLSI